MPFSKVLSNQGDSGVTPETLSQVMKIEYKTWKYIYICTLQAKYVNAKQFHHQARVFVIPGPREKFSETEINHMKKYLEVKPQSVLTIS